MSDARKFVARSLIYSDALLREHGRDCGRGHSVCPFGDFYRDWDAKVWDQAQRSGQVFVAKAWRSFAVVALPPFV